MKAMASLNHAVPHLLEACRLDAAAAAAGSCRVDDVRVSQSPRQKLVNNSCFSRATRGWVHVFNICTMSSFRGGPRARLVLVSCHPA